MTVAQTATDPPTPAIPSVDDVPHGRFVLGSLLDMAHRVASVMHDHIVAPPPADGSRPAVPILAAASAFDRASRNIRQTLMLGERYGKADGPAGQRARQRVAARKRIVREVEDVIQRNASGPRAERLYRELAERLEGPDLEDEIGDRPVAEIIAELCRDLGIAHAEGTHPWRRRTPADIAALCALAARPAGEAGEAMPMPAAAGSHARPPTGAAATHSVAADLDDREPGDPGTGDPGTGDPGGESGAPEGAAWDLASLDDAELERQALAAADPRSNPGDPGGPVDPAGPKGPGGLGDPGMAGPGRQAAHPAPPHPPAPDFCDYQPGARAWPLAKWGLPGPAAPDTTRPSGRASFRGG